MSVKCDIFDEMFDKMGINRHKLKRKNDQTFCKLCEENSIEEMGDGTLICISCGLNLGDKIDSSSEWKYDVDGEDNSRSGMPIDRRFVQTSFAIYMSTKKKCKLYDDLKRGLIWNGVKNKERAMKKRFDNIQFSCKIYGVSNAIIEYSQNIYYNIQTALKNSDKYCDYRADNNKGLQAAAIFYAFQDEGKPKTCKEIANMFDISTKHVSQGLTVFYDLMGDKYKRIVSKYSDYIDDYCNRVYLDDSVKARVKEVADKASELGILETNAPTSIVAGCIYYVVVEMAISSLKKSALSTKCGVSSPTITKVCDKLFEYTLELL